MRRGRKRAWVLLAVWTVITIVALSLPIEKPPRIIRRGLDKVAHTAMFTVTGVLAQAAIPWFSILIAMPVAIGLELMQKKLPHRDYDPVELVANVLGVLLGIACYETAIRLEKR